MSSNSSKISNLPKADNDNITNKAAMSEWNDAMFQLAVEKRIEEKTGELQNTIKNLQFTNQVYAETQRRMKLEISKLESENQKLKRNEKTHWDEGMKADSNEAAKNEIQSKELVMEKRENENSNIKEMDNEMRQFKKTNDGSGKVDLNQSPSIDKGVQKLILTAALVVSFVTSLCCLAGAVPQGKIAMGFVTGILGLSLLYTREEFEKGIIYCVILISLCALTSQFEIGTEGLEEIKDLAGLN